MILVNKHCALSLSILLVCAALSVYAAVPPPENLHYVQMGIYETEEEAQLKEYALSALGFSPVQVVYEAPWFKVL